MFKKRLQKWLEIEKPKESVEKALKKEVKDLEKSMDSLVRDLKFWKQQFKKQAGTKKCTKCKGVIDLWPYNQTVAYYIKGNRVTHKTCPPKEVKGSNT